MGTGFYLWSGEGELPKRYIFNTLQLDMHFHINNSDKKVKIFYVTEVRIRLFKTGSCVSEIQP